MRFATVAALLALSISAFAAQPPLPRPAKEFTIVEPSGKQTLLSSYKGKVVAFAFMFTTCPHCQRESVLLTKLQREYGPRGFQALGTAYNDATPPMVAQFVKEFGVGFPVGFASRDSALSFMGFSVMDQVWVPQIVLIDRKGMIREQSESKPDGKLQEEAYLRSRIEALLKESAPVSGGAAKPATVAKAPASK